MKKVIYLVLILLFSLSIGQGLYSLKKGFSCRRIHALSLTASDDFSEEVNLALEQTFHYLGRGRQCFAFASEDGRYVLKFPRTDIYKTPLWARALPVHSYRKALETEHSRRERFVLESFHISATELQSQTGTLALHIGQSAPKGSVLKVVDALHCRHHLPLEKVSFILQRKHPIWTKAFTDSLEKGDKKKAEMILDALVEVIVERGKKGILNKDRSFLRNYGFDGVKAYQIDIGSFFRKADLSLDAAYQKSVIDSLDPVQEWLLLKSPEMKLYLDEKLKKLL
jgi:hypothetical protein